MYFMAAWNAWSADVTCQRSGIDHPAGGRHRGDQAGPVQGWDIVRLDDDPDLNPKFAGERKIALIMGRHSHDGAGAVGHQDIVGNPDGSSSRH